MAGYLLTNQKLQNIQNQEITTIKFDDLQKKIKDDALKCDDIDIVDVEVLDIENCVNKYLEYMLYTNTKNSRFVNNTII
jgi:hypothetical protein